MPKDSPPGKTYTLSDSFVQRVIQYIGREEIRRKLHDDILDPLLNHVMKRVLPYIILTCALFIVLLIVVLLALGVIIVHIRSSSNALHMVSEVAPLVSA